MSVKRESRFFSSKEALPNRNDLSSSYWSQPDYQKLISVSGVPSGTLPGAF